MSCISQTMLNQIGLVLGFFGSILLSFSYKVGMITEDGRVKMDGLDDMDSIEKNVIIVQNSHRRNRHFTPIGWGMICVSFFIQFIATFMQSS